MLAEIAKIVNFTYEINQVKDGKYGAQDKETGVWSGMVGELIRKEADLGKLKMAGTISQLLVVRRLNSAHFLVIAHSRLTLRTDGRTHVEAHES